MKVSIFALAFMAFAAAPFSQADDAVASQLYDKALEKYRLHRADSLQVSKEILDILNRAEAEVQNRELRYDILVLASRTLYWQGMHTDGDENKKVLFIAGKEKGDAAVLAAPDFSEAYFFAGINLARWAETNGIVASISRRGELVAYMEKASDITRTTRDGEPGDTVDGNGPDRVIGRMYEKLPGVLGGDHDLAVRILRRAVEMAPMNALNVVYLGASLLKGSRDEKAEGRRLLEALVAQDPRVYGVQYDRVPETIEEFALARGLLAGRDLP